MKHNLCKVDCYIYIRIVLPFKGRNECSETQGEAIVAMQLQQHVAMLAYVCSYGIATLLFQYKNCSRSDLSLYNKHAA